MIFNRFKNAKNIIDSKSNHIKNVTKSPNIRNEIVVYAKKFEGNPYRWGGTSLTKGTDCSGFTQSVYKDMGIKIPRTSKMQAAGGRK
ncbi:MAG: hypothetical protein K0S47_4291 [Herbinix sp.]|jgi:cell wall-associated NlpC family hydrolase|nr:hypothetical protein [Herbinix sp.]